PMTVACGVDADADAVEGRGGGHGGNPGTRGGRSGLGARGREEGGSVPRGTLSKGVLVLSGRRPRKYRDLPAKAGGTTFSKRSKPQGTNSSPHDPAISMAERLEMSIQG